MKSQHKYFHGKNELLMAEGNLVDPEIIEEGVELRQRILSMDPEEAKLIVLRVLKEQVRLAKLQVDRSWRRSDV